MNAAAALPLPVVLPIVGAVAAPLAARVHRRLPLILGLLAVPGALVVLCLIAPRVYRGHGHFVTHFLSNQRPVHGQSLGIAFTADPFGLSFALLTTVVGSLLLLWIHSELGELGARELGGLTCLMQLLLAALVGAALTADLVNLFVWFEVAAIASYGLTGFFVERPVALEAAFKNAVLTSTAGFLVFVGAAMLYATSGALNLGQLHLTVPASPTRAELLAIALLVAGFATKAGLMPFHGWLPDAHTPVPGAVSALFSALMVDLGVVGLARLGLLAFPHLAHLAGLLTGLGIASAVIGALLTLVQDDLKRLLAWDTVSQMGILIAGFASRTEKGTAGAVYHLINHGLFKALLFLCAGAVVHATGKTGIAEMGGLARRMPAIAAGFTVGCLAIAGVPPLNGFASLGLLHDGLEHEPVVFACALLAQVVTVAALGRAAYAVFFRRRADPYEHVEPRRAGMRVSLAVLSAACLGFGALAPELVPHVAGPAASALLHPRAYAAAALSSGGAVPASSVDFSYGDPKTWLIGLGEVLAGLLLLALVLRVPKVPRPLQWLRDLHTGSVNDYAAYAAIGTATVAYVLLA
jgi:multicomponent Na+:H+ antiporter subunit D